MNRRARHNRRTKLADYDRSAPARKSIKQRGSMHNHDGSALRKKLHHQGDTASGGAVDAGSLSSADGTRSFASRGSRGSSEPNADRQSLGTQAQIEARLKQAEEEEKEKAKRNVRRGSKGLLDQLPDIQPRAPTPPTPARKLLPPTKGTEPGYIPSPKGGKKRTLLNGR